MSIILNMGNYEIESDSMEAEYGEEILCAGWNPAVELVCQQQTFVPTRRQMFMPADLVTVDAELFLQKMYACQR